MEVLMAMGRPKSALVLHAEQCEQLESLANSRSLPTGLVRRAKIILLSASGRKLIATSNRRAQPFVWTATADSIFAKVERLCERIYGAAH
jgi:putative transposase